MWAAERLGFEFVIAAPVKYQPSAAYLKQFKNTQISCETDPTVAVNGADLLYTDVWVSMGQEEESTQRIADLKGYQINRGLISMAKKDAVVMHCLPAYREKEISNESLEDNADAIFQQAENRLHVQKAVLVLLNKSR
jgi:ornithine carbamoyltransferase